MSGLLAIMVQIAAVLAPIGTVGHFAWKRIEKQFAECEAREHRLRFEVRRLSKGCRIMFTEMRRTDPSNPVLDRVAAILHRAYDPTVEIDDEFDDLLDDVDIADARIRKIR